MTKQEFKVTVNSAKESINYTVFKTEKGAISFGNKVAKEAFHGEAVEIAVVAL